jgi:hypothetical protein
VVVKVSEERSQRQDHQQPSLAATSSLSSSFVAFDIEQWYIDRAVFSLTNDNSVSSSTSKQQQQQQQQPTNHHRQSNGDLLLLGGSSSSSLTAPTFYNNDFVLSQSQGSRYGLGGVRPGAATAASQLTTANLKTLLAELKTSASHSSPSPSPPSSSFPNSLATHQFNKYQICFT